MNINTNSNTINSQKTKAMVLCAFFAALTGVFSAISIPLPFTPVPINLATLSVFLAGGLLGSKRGSLAMTVYVLLGVIGLPVFSGFTSGVGILVGPTGGYIAGYILAAFIVGITQELIRKKGFACRFFSFDLPIVFSLIAGLLGCYALGTFWFMQVTGTGLVASLSMCVVPFLIGDALKIITATILIKKLSPIVGRAF